MDAKDALRVARRDPINDERKFGICFRNPHDKFGPDSVYLDLYPGEAPELHLTVESHSLGVLRGDLLLTFFDCLRRRCGMGDADTF
jgi:hypothetical protein